MKPKWNLPLLTRACLAALAAVLFLYCGGESSAPPAPPAPPPFQPQTIVVQLGTKGGATTLISTQAGGWTRNGQPFTSGSTVTGENAASYRLTLTGGTWAAEFLPGDPEAVVLGISGDAVQLQAQEDGSYKLGDDPVESGKVVKAGNGNDYRLVLGDDGWMAEYVSPPAQVVHLGTSGESRQVSRLEDGTFTVNGVPLVAGEVIETSRGNNYSLTVNADGMWAATFVQGDPQYLQLGTSGSPALLIYRQENGTYQLDGEPLLGGRVVEANNGSSYRLTLGSDGQWIARFIPQPVTVRLGTSGGLVSLVPNEDGTWERGSNRFSSGDTIRGVNGFEYRLTLGVDGWIVEALPMTVEVEVTGSDAEPLSLARLEDGTYLFDGSPVRSGDTVSAGGSTYTLRRAGNRWTAQFLRGEVFVELGQDGDSLTLIRRADGTFEYDGRRVRNGSIQRSPNTGIRYRLRLTNGVWSASVYVPPVIDPGDGDTGGPAPVVAENILDALPSHLINSDGAFQVSDDDLIKAGADSTNSDGDTIDYSRFGGSGRYEDDTFVESAIRAINKILGPIEKDNLANGTDAQRFVAGVVINANWSDVRTEVRKIFKDDDRKISLGTNPPQRAGETDIDEAIDDLEDLREDLSDIAKFKSTYKSKIDEAIAPNSNVSGDKIFNARKQVLALGSTTNTRFGVNSTLASSTTAEDVARGSGDYTSKAFAFSPLPATPTASLPSRGTARYGGRTWAIDGNQVLYSGSIELLASLGIQQITSKVTGLRRSDNNATWVRSGREVDEIQLPEVNHGQFTTTGSFSKSGVAKVVDEELGFKFDTDVSGSELKGQFVGADQRAGTAVIGTWKVGDEMTGSFGAERTGTNPVRLPPGDSDVEVTYKNSGAAISFDTTAKTATIEEFLPKYSLTSLSGWSNRAHSDSTNNNRATLRLRHTSLTRFGAWKLVDHSDASNLTLTNKGVFAYSSLLETAYSDGDANYPRRVRAVYRGGTVGIDHNDNLFNGSYALSVQWGSTVGGTLTAVISGSSLFSFGGDRVSQIGFEQTFTGVSNSSSLKATLQYASGTKETLSDGIHHQFKFLGEGVDGPSAVIGDWAVTKSSNTVRGSFGANLVPAP